MVVHVDLSWARAELIPFLNVVFPARSNAKWETVIAHAENAIDEIPFYEDFPYTIECTRLSLINVSELTEEEGTQFARFRNNPQLSVEVFVRHAIRHGVWYPLFSLGHTRSPDFPHPQASTTAASNEFQGGYATSPEELEAAEARGGGSKTANYDGVEKFNGNAGENFSTIVGMGGTRSGGIAARIGYVSEATYYGGYAAGGGGGWQYNHGPGFVGTTGHMYPPAHPYHDFPRPFEHHHHFIASSQSVAVAFKSDAEAYHLRGEANDFLPGAAAHGRPSE